MGLFDSFSIARSGMYVNERGLYVTGHNITNTNTDGYVRQQIEATTSLYRDLPGVGQVGLGADIQGVRQYRQSFLDNIYRNEAQTLGNYQIKNKTLKDIEAIMDEPFGEGLQSVLNEYWDSWQELVKEPESLTVRAVVRQRGEALARQVNHIAGQIDQHQNDMNQQIFIRVNELNGYTKEVAKLNQKIFVSEASREDANDLKDKRNLLLDKISVLTDASFNELRDGQINVLIGGQSIVNRGESINLKVEESNDYGIFFVPKLENTDIEVNLTNGEIKGLLDSRGIVFGSMGSEENGTPNTKIDVNMVIDNSDTSSEYLEDIKKSIKDYVNELNNKGLDYNLRLITSPDNSTVWTKADILAAGESFGDAVNSINSSSNSDNNFDDVIGKMGAIGYRQDASKYAVVFTKESIGGDDNDIDQAKLKDYTDQLNKIGIKVSVVTDPAMYNKGSGTEKFGWQAVTSATGGKLYDINAEDYSGLLKSINNDITMDKNSQIDYYENSGNILPDLKKRLSAFVNVLFREINYYHSGGVTMNGEKGEDFFVPINDKLPLEIGNIKINDKFSDLDNIVASTTKKNGDSDIALTIANLHNLNILHDKTGEINANDFYRSIITTIGTESSEIAKITDNQNKLVKSADDFRKSVTDVSMDEEMTNMMKYKYAYGASSRLIGVLNDMLEMVISGLKA